MKLNIKNKLTTEEWYKKLYDLLEKEKNPTLSEINSILDSEVSNISTVIITKKSIGTNSKTDNVIEENNLEISLDNDKSNKEECSSKLIINEYTISKCKHFDLIIPELIKKYIDDKLKPNCKKLLEIVALKAKNESAFPLNEDSEKEIDVENRLCELSNWMTINKEFAENKENLAHFISQATICFIYYEKPEIYKKAIFELVNNIVKVDANVQKYKINSSKFWNSIIQSLLTNDKNKAVGLVSCNSLPNQSKDCDSEEELKILKDKYNVLKTKLNNLSAEYDSLKEENNKLEKELSINTNNIKALNKDIDELNAKNEELQNKYKKIETELDERNSAFEEFKVFLEKEKIKEITATKLNLKEALMIDLNNAKIFFECEKGNDNIDAGLRKLERALDNIKRLDGGKNNE